MVLQARSALLVALLLVACSQDSATHADGPYAFHDGKDLVVRSIVAGKPERTVNPDGRTISYTIAGVAKRVAVRDTTLEVPPSTLKGVDRLIAISDVHGHADGFVEVLKLHGIVDANLDWSFGDGHVVLAGDLFDRGDGVNECLWLMYQLEEQASAAGGVLHVLLGNHDDWILRAKSTKYVHERYVRTAELLDTSYPALYGADSVLGRWLRTKNVVERIGDTVFVHGGIDPTVFTEAVSLDDLNGAYRRLLAGESIGEDVARQLESLIWYRGYFSDPGERPEPAEVDRALARFGARRIVVGHTTHDEIRPVYDGARVIGVDAGRCERGEALLLEKGVPWRLKKDASRVRLASE